MWIVSIISCTIIGSIIIVIIVTIAQFFGGDDTIRYIITSQYLIGGLINFKFGEILLILLEVISFQLALAGHTLQVEKVFQERLWWLPRRASHHYEMEKTLSCFFYKMKKK
jgi:hypothetical protein